MFKKFFINMSNNKLGYYLPFILAFLLLAWLIIVPLLMMFSYSFLDFNSNFSLEGWKAISSKQNLLAIKNSLLLGLYVTFLSTLFAIPGALILAKTRLRKYYFIDLILMIPFMVPPYINSQGWIFFMQRGGILRSISESFTPFANSFFSFYGMGWVMAMHTFPFILTILKNAFLSIPPSLDEAIDVYSSSKISRFTKVYLPILLPNLVIAMVLVFIKTLAEYGTPATFGPLINLYTFTVIICNYMQVYPISFSSASSMSTILILICMLLWMFQTYITSYHSYKLDKESGSKIIFKRVGTILGVIYLIILFIISAIIPISSILITSLLKTYGYPITFDNMTFDNYIFAFSDNSGFTNGFNAIFNTFYIAIVSSLLSLVLGLIFAIYSYKRRTNYQGKSIEFLSLLPEMIPNVVTGIGLIMLYSTIRRYLPIYRTNFMLILAYTIIFLPNMVSYIKSGLTSFDSSLIEAGRIFAPSNIKINTRIIIPNILKSTFYGFCMTFIVSCRELVTAKLLSKSGFYVISTYISFQFEQGNSQAGMAMAIFSVLLTIILILPLEYFIMKDKLTKKED